MNMERAAILVSVDPTATEKTFHSIERFLKKENVLKYSMMVYGIYDYLFIVECPLQKLQEIILNIRKNKSIKQTVTLISV